MSHDQIILPFLLAMKACQRILLPAALVAGAVATAPSQARAQAQVQSSLELGGRTLALSRREEAVLADVRHVLQGGSPGVQDAALEAARREVNSPDARYVLAQYQLVIGGQRNDDDLRAPALDILIASGMASQARLASYLDVRGGIAFRRGDFDIARMLWTRLLEFRPDDPDLLANLAQVRQAQNDPQGAAELLERAIAARTSSGGTTSEAWYRQRMTIAFQAAQAEPAIAAAHNLVRAYPTAQNWRDAFVVYRQLAVPQGNLEIDLMRLMRVAGALVRANEYLRLAQLLRQAGSVTEAKAVLDEGLARGLINASESPTREIIAEVNRFLPDERARLETLQRQGPSAAARADAPGLADSLVAAGRHAEAVALYRGALQAVPVNAAELQTRLGIALFLAGQRADAEAAFRLAANASAAAPISGYADLAQFWLAWLAQPPAQAAADPANS